MTHAHRYVTAAEARGDHRVWLHFDDGLEGEIDLGDELWGPVFEPLQDPQAFAAFRVDRTLVWACGADLAPEFLYELVQAGRVRAA